MFFSFLFLYFLWMCPPHPPCILNILFDFSFLPSEESAFSGLPLPPDFRPRLASLSLDAPSIWVPWVSAILARLNFFSASYDFDQPFLATLFLWFRFLLLTLPPFLDFPNSPLFSHPFSMITDLDSARSQNQLSSFSSIFVLGDYCHAPPSDVSDPSPFSNINSHVPSGFGVPILHNPFTPHFKSLSLLPAPSSSPRSFLISPKSRGYPPPHYNIFDSFPFSYISLRGAQALRL